MGGEVGMTDAHSARIAVAPDYSIVDDWLREWPAELVANPWVGVGGPSLLVAACRHAASSQAADWYLIAGSLMPIGSGGDTQIQLEVILGIAGGSAHSKRPSPAAISTHQWLAPPWLFRREVVRDIGDRCLPVWQLTKQAPHPNGGLEVRHWLEAHLPKPPSWWCCIEDRTSSWGLKWGTEWSAHRAFGKGTLI